MFVLGQMRKVRVCMAPSVAIGGSDASTMGNIVEQLVLKDYLADTTKVPPHPYERPAVTITNWWDTGNQQHYKEILLRRHDHVDEGQLRRMRRLKVPDLSTWNSDYRRKTIELPGYSQKRSEFYEVKPDSIWGELAGIEKLFVIEQNNADLALPQYKRGTWYPQPEGPSKIGKAEIQFTAFDYVLSGFQYSLRRLERAARTVNSGLKVNTPIIEIERRREGLLLYLICVDLELDFDGEEAIAKNVVRRLYQALTSNLEQKQRDFERQFVDALVPARRDHKARPPQLIDPVTAKVLQAIEIEEKFLSREIDVVDELRPSIPDLAKTLFSKLRGLPGERYLICSDETYYNDEIKGPNRQRAINRISPLQLRVPLPMGAALAAGGAMVKVASPVLASIYVVGKLLNAPESLFSIRSEWVKAEKWLEAHPAFTILAGSVVVYGTALVIASAGTAGAVAMYGGSGLAASGALGAEASGIAGQAGRFGLVRGLASEGLSEVALPSIGHRLAEQLAAEASGTVLPAVERDVFERLLIEEGQKLAAEEADRLITRSLSQLATQQAERILLRQGTARSAQSLVYKALAAGGATIAGVSARMAISHGKVGDAVDEAAASQAPPIAFEIGQLFLLRIFDAVRNEDLPPLQNQFDTSKFSSEFAGSISARSDASEAMAKRRYLGVFTCL